MYQNAKLEKSIILRVTYPIFTLFSLLLIFKMLLFMPGELTRISCEFITN